MITARTMLDELYSRIWNDSQDKLTKTVEMTGICRADLDFFILFSHEQYEGKNPISDFLWTAGREGDSRLLMDLGLPEDSKNGKWFIQLAYHCLVLRLHEAGMQQHIPEGELDDRDTAAFVMTVSSIHDTIREIEQIHAEILENRDISKKGAKARSKKFEEKKREAYRRFNEGNYSSFASCADDIHKHLGVSSDTTKRWIAEECKRITEQQKQIRTLALNPQ